MHEIPVTDEDIAFVLGKVRDGECVGEKKGECVGEGMASSVGEDRGGERAPPMLPKRICRFSSLAA